MPFCANCGAPVEGRFCSKCGTAVDLPGAAPPPVEPTTTSAGMRDNVASALCYVLGFITGILFLVLEPYNKNKKIRFHAFQSIFLTVAYFVIHIAVVMLAIITGGIGGLPTPLVGLVFFVLWLFMMWKSYQDQKVVLPIIGPLAEKQA